MFRRREKADKLKGDCSDNMTYVFDSDGKAIKLQDQERATDAAKVCNKSAK